MIINPYVYKNPVCVPTTGGTSLIANGTTNLFDAPAYGFYDYSWSSFIYPVSLISTPRQITGIQIEVGFFSTPYTFNNQTIKMAHLAIGTTTFDSAPAVDWSDMPVTDVTIVKSFNWTILANGIIDINFDTNFCYNGTSNLILGWENRDGSWAVGYGYGKTIGSSNSGAIKSQDGSYPTGNGTRISNRLNLRLKY